MTFTHLVDEVQKLSLDEKEAMKNLLEHYLIEERRDEIARHGEESRQLLREGKLVFSSDVSELKEMMQDE